jgi:transketolase C-terminal domain/subunit
LLFRPFELLRTYVNNEKVNIKLVGSGRDDDYSHDGFSHWAGDDIKVISTLENIKTYKPDKLTDALFNEFMENNTPSYINLIR